MSGKCVLSNCRYRGRREALSSEAVEFLDVPFVVRCHTLGRSLMKEGNSGEQGLTVFLWVLSQAVMSSQFPTRRSSGHRMPTEFFNKQLLALLFSWFVS